MKRYFATINLMNGRVHAVYDNAEEIPREFVKEQSYFPISERSARKYKRLLREGKKYARRLEKLAEELKLPIKSAGARQ